MLLNGKWITEEIKEEIKINLETNENETKWSKIYGTIARALLRGKIEVTQAYFRKQVKLKQPKLILKGARKRRKTKHKISRRK